MVGVDVAVASMYSTDWTRSRTGEIVAEKRDDHGTNIAYKVYVGGVQHER